MFPCFTPMLANGCAPSDIYRNAFLSTIKIFFAGMKLSSLHTRYHRPYRLFQMTLNLISQLICNDW